MFPGRGRRRKSHTLDTRHCRTCCWSAWFYARDPNPRNPLSSSVEIYAKNVFVSEFFFATQNHKSLQLHLRKKKYLKMALKSASKKEPLESPLAASQTAFKMHERPSRPFSSSRILILVKTWRRSRLCRSSECNWLRNTLVSVGSSKPRPTVAPHVKMSVARYVPHVKQ